MKSILRVFLISAGIGTLIGMLIAPDKGSVTRVKLLNGTKELAENLRARISSLKEQLRATDPEHRNKQEFYERAFGQDIHTVV